MKYVVAFGGKRGPALLDDGVTRRSMAEECRNAALAFMSGVGLGWDKIDLALWLTGPYARVTRHSPRGERVADLGANDAIEDATIEDLVTRVRGQVLAALERAALDEGEVELAADAIQRGLVRRAVDRDGRDVWIPVDAPRLRLRDRVTALFAADALNDPAAYRELFVCHRCERVVFDEGAKRLGVCASHRISGIVTRGAGRAAGQ